MLERLSSPDQPQYQTISFIYWLQWNLSKQLKSASEFARQHQIALKGDLPIGWILFCKAVLAWTVQQASLIAITLRLYTLSQ